MKSDFKLVGTANNRHNDIFVPSVNKLCKTDGLFYL